MARTALIFVLTFILVLILISQVIMPMFSKNTKFFWLFRKAPEVPDTDYIASKNVYKDIQKKADKNYHERQQIKQEVQKSESILRDIKDKTK